MHVPTHARARTRTYEHAHGWRPLLPYHLLNPYMACFLLQMLLCITQLAAGHRPLAVVLSYQKPCVNLTP